MTLNPKYYYLAVDLLTLFFPLVFSFYSKANFSKKWKYLWIAILIPGLIFIAWDELFTRLGVWGFNDAYVSGLYIGNLPVEEILFFICIPYACVFTYEALGHLVHADSLGRHQKVVSTILVAICLVVAVGNFNRWYTCTTFLALGACIVWLERTGMALYLGRFYLAYLIILVPFFIVNGILTGSGIEEPIVWYNNGENLAIRLGTIPVEDIFYGMLLVLMNVSLFEWMQLRYSPSPGNSTGA
jgi:lycopene cyclase domain-containing protein